MDKKQAQIFHFDLYGKREDKYQFLEENAISTIEWNELQPQEPELFFVPKDFETKKDYDKGFSVVELFKINSVGIVTARDGFVIDKIKENLKNRIEDFFLLTKDELQLKYGIKENKSWKINDVKLKAKTFNQESIIPVSYRPFDNRLLYYENNFIERSRYEVMQHFLNGNNVGLALCKQFKSGDSYQHVLITNKLIESSFVSNKTSEITTSFPLYLYPKTTKQQRVEEQSERTPNLNLEIVKLFAEKIKLTFTNEKEATENTFAPIDILDYIYAVLHSLTYREKYKEFLKINFPRVPYPKDRETFWQLVKIGSKIRQIHLLESPVVEDYITQYPINGDNIVNKIEFQQNKVYINETQYFDNVPQVAWEFYIGGYQPVQKWLKDRKDRKLDFDDVLHYQKIIVALSETDRLMKEIDMIEIE